MTRVELFISISTILCLTWKQLQLRAIEDVLVLGLELGVYDVVLSGNPGKSD